MVNLMNLNQIIMADSDDGMPRWQVALIIIILCMIIAVGIIYTAANS